jgi:chromosome segregation ATPase
MREKQIIEKASGVSPENIIKGLADVQVSIGKSLTDLEQKLIAESNKFFELQQAISIETSKLKDLHDVVFQSNSLAALIQAQEERTQSFEKGMNEQRRGLEEELRLKRDEWRKEQTTHESFLKEREAQIKKQHERDEEEYKYRLQVERRKDTDEYGTKKLQLMQELDALKQRTEKELAEKRAVLTAQEKEVSDLRAQVAAFPRELEDAVKKAETALRAAIKQQSDFDVKLAAKEAEAEKKLQALKTANLEEIIAKQQSQITEITKQLQTATKQVQEMAVKAIESAAGVKSRLSGETSSSGEKAG